MDDITIEPFTPSDASAAATLLSHAFLHQPDTMAIFKRHDESVRRQLEILAKSTVLTRPASRLWLARRDDKLVGVLNMLEWPRCQLSFLEALRIMPRALLILKGAFPRFAKLAKVWRKHDPLQPHVHLGTLAVLPQFQRQGIGSRLLDTFCEIVDQGREAAYLETDRPENISLYARFGFAVTAEEPIWGVPNWFMWRTSR